MTNAKTYLVIRNSADQYVVNDTFKDENFKDVCNFVVMLYSGKQAEYLCDHNVNAKALADVEPSELRTFEMSCTFDVLCNSTQEAMDALDTFKQQHANDNVLVWDKVGWGLVLRQRRSSSVRSQRRSNVYGHGRSAESCAGKVQGHD